MKQIDWIEDWEENDTQEIICIKNLRSGTIKRFIKGGKYSYNDSDVFHSKLIGDGVIKIFGEDGGCMYFNFGPETQLINIEIHRYFSMDKFFKKI